MCLFISTSMNRDEDIQQGDTKHNDLSYQANGDTGSNGVIKYLNLYFFQAHWMIRTKS